MFFSFDGVDGAGKSTQLELFCGWLREAGHDVLTCRDPGTTQLGELVREILLNRDDVPIKRRSEMLLYMAARTQLVEELIEPALRAGKIVVSDRFLLANIAYQGYGGRLDIDAVRNIGQFATAGRHPDLTFVLDMDVNDAANRIERDKDRMESQGHEFAERVRNGFLTEARRNDESIHVLDAARLVDKVQADIRAAAAKKLVTL